MGGPEIEAFLTHLAHERQVSPSTRKQALSAILFLYKEVQQTLALLDLSPLAHALAARQRTCRVKLQLRR